MQTTLDESTLSRVLAIVDEVGEAIGESIDQDNLLMLICLQLAYSVEKVSKRLEALEKTMSRISPWEPPEEPESGI
jgi:hypothetical protein